MEQIFRLRRGGEIVGYEKPKRNRFTLGWETFSDPSCLNSANPVAHDRKEQETGHRDYDGTPIFEGDILLNEQKSMTGVATAVMGEWVMLCREDCQGGCPLSRVAPFVKVIGLDSY